MNEQFDQHLREKYPLIFAGRCEMSVGDGWFDIIDNLCGNIQAHIDNVARQRERNIKWNSEVNDPEYEWQLNSFIKREERAVPELVEQVVATQIKEKFGTLRFYYHGGDDYIRGLEAMADSMSAVLCEDCGSPGKLRSRKKEQKYSWIRTLCDNHADEQGYVEDES